MSNTCRLFHDWPKWTNDIATVYADPANPVRPTFENRKVDIQYKYCKRCNKKKVRFAR